MNSTANPVHMVNVYISDSLLQKHSIAVNNYYSVLDRLISVQYHFSFSSQLRNNFAKIHFQF